VFGAPLAVVADADGGDGLVGGSMLDGDGESLRSVGGGDDAAVAIGLFLECLAGFDPDTVGPIQFLIPLYRSEIGCA